jgi:VanZ family protein
VTARTFRLWAPVVAYMAAIFAASSMQSPPVPGGADKPWHALAYLGLSIVVVRALAGGFSRRIGGRVAAAAIVIAVLYGVSDEVHQMFVPGRTAAFDDLIADTVGACAGAILCWAWGIIRSTSRDEL